MLTVKEIIYITANANVGCNNGVLDDVDVIFNSGEIRSLRTCRCGKGCNGSDRLPEIGQEFKSMEDFYAYTENESYEAEAIFMNMYNDWIDNLVSIVKGGKAK